MKILYIVKNELDKTAEAMLEQHRKDADVTIIEMTADKDYDNIVTQVFDNDKVICW